MTTQVSFENVFSGDGLWFRFGDGKAFILKSFNNGVMVIDPLDGYFIHPLARNIAGCFKEGSNLYGLKAIEFEFDGIYFSVTSENATPEKIIQFWDEKNKENRIKYEKEQEEYIKASKYRAERTKELKAKYRHQNVEELAKYSMQNVEFEFKDDEARKVWDNFVEISSKDIVRYAECWAKFMQYLMANHEGVTVAKIAKHTSQVVDFDGVTDSIYCRVVKVLSQVWKHGEALRKWHNKEYGYEGDGVVNSSVLTVGVD